MRVTFDSMYRRGIEEINASASRLAEWQRQVSSQKRVHGPSDDPSAAAAVVGEYAEMAALDQFRQTTDSVESRLMVIDTLLSDAITNLTAAQTVAAAGRSTVPGPEQRQALALELRGIRDNLLQDFNGQYRGVFLFAGTAALTSPFQKDGSGVVQPYAGTAAVQELDIDRNRRVEVTIDGGSVAGDLFQTLESLAAAIESGDTAQIDVGLAGVNAAFTRLTTAQSRVGITLADLDEHRGRLGSARRAADSRRSSLEDANLAEAISRMQLADTAYRAALSALGSTAQRSLMDYLR
jgi:flagellar hook-associated protein 3 FlgL